MRTFFPMLPKERIPALPATLVTTVSISEPFSTTTKSVTTGGLPSVKSMVKVPVQSAFTVYLPLAGVCVKLEADSPAIVTESICLKGTVAVKVGHRNAHLKTSRPRDALDGKFGALQRESVMAVEKFVVAAFDIT